MEYRLDVLLSRFSTKELLNQLFYVASSQSIQYLTKDGLTWLSFLNLFGRQRKGGEQLHKYLDNEFSHSVCRRDLGIDVETIQKVFNRLE